MISFRKTVAGLLGHDRRERRGTYLLSVLLAVLLAVRLLAFRVPERGEMSDEILDAVTAVNGVAGSDRTLPQLFTFDPNTSSYEELLQLGLTERHASTLVKYRSSGARFRRPEDIGRVYGIDSAAAARLIPYISIADARETEDGAAKGTRSQQGSNEQYPGSRYPYAAGSSDRESGTRRSPASGNGGAAILSAEEYADRSGGSARPLIDLNICTAAELEQLPGIGPVLSERIIRYRALLGGFVTREQLGEVYGIDSAVTRLVSGMVTLTYEGVRPLCLDSISFGSLASHPYVGYERARLITAYRSLGDGPLTLGSLVGAGLLSPLQAERLAPYVMPPEGVAGADYEFILSKVLK